VQAHGGARPVEQGEGDSIVAAFSRASDAVAAAVDAQRALLSETWPTQSPLRVRMAIHTGETRLRDEGNYVGGTIVRTARLRAIAHGGQVLVSSATHDLVVDELPAPVELVDLGTHRLKDLARPERVWQLAHPELGSEFPPLASLDSVPNNLPVSLSTFIGRFDEIDTIVRLVLDNRLVTLMGPGGAGKTRLAQQVGAELVETFRGGVWWVDLVGVQDPTLLPSAISRAALFAEDRDDRLGGVLNSAWLRSRKEAGLPQVRVHDLKHTFGRRLRAAGVSFEDRQDLLGHVSGRITTHYSAAELSRLVEAANKVCETDGRKPELVVLRGLIHSQSPQNPHSRKISTQ
jgi:hypothetical protein